MTLPGDRRGLFDAALDLLLVRWDEQRGITIDGAWPHSKEEQLVLLRRFAYSMVVNGEVILSRLDANARFGRAIQGLRAQRAEPDEIRFVHRTFRDYLAARGCRRRLHRAAHRARARGRAVVLAKVDFGDLRVPVRRWDRVLALKHFARLTAVRCTGDITPPGDPQGRRRRTRRGGGAAARCPGPRRGHPRLGGATLRRCGHDRLSPGHPPAHPRRGRPA
ncbi:MAG TPA: hypothetical protein VFX16_09280 [Pseudonocardiaceae bacterium]|nr:hypothetical protein [Pseudonocardiaceae bacterium]